MTKSSSLFLQFFKKKSYWVHTIILIQFISVIFGALFFFLKNETGDVIGGSDPTVINRSLLALTKAFIISFPFANIVYLLISIWQNEKINRSQTWRLAAISDSKFYLDNSLSSFISYLYLLFLNLLEITILFLMTFVCSKGIRKAFNYSFQNFIKDMASWNWEYLFNWALLVILFGLSCYLIVSFLNFSSRSLIDFLPGIKSTIAVNFIRFLLIIIISWLLYKIINSIGPIVDIYNGVASAADINLRRVILEYFGFDLIILLVNTFIFSKFVEAKQNN